MNYPNGARISCQFGGQLIASEVIRLRVIRGPSLHPRGVFRVAPAGFEFLSDATSPWRCVTLCAGLNNKARLMMPLFDRVARGRGDERERERERERETRRSGLDPRVLAGPRRSFLPFSLRFRVHGNFVVMLAP
jgi:hypothetical protein